MVQMERQYLILIIIIQMGMEVILFRMNMELRLSYEEIFLFKKTGMKLKY